MMNLGKSELEDSDWEQSDLHWSKHWLLGLLCYFVPYKVKGGVWSKTKALIANVLTLLMLRPIADRMVIITHDPVSRRVYYRLSAKRNALRQFYIILEQFPELILQFYTFQIVFNKVLHPCSSPVTYPAVNEDNIVCTTLGIEQLTLCGELFRIYSMALAFNNIPTMIVLLERDFRKLDPAMPRLSSFGKNTIQASYVMMIPARLFMFSGLMHAEPRSYMFMYLGFRTLWELFINMVLHRQYRKLTNINYHNVVDEDGTLRDRVFKMLGALWMTLLFSMRDILVISLRTPNAYMNKVSEANHQSLRSWKMIGLLSFPYLLEGFMGAILIEQDYPCGASADIFRYLGWFCLTLLIFSVTLMVLVADFLDPKLIRLIPERFLRQSLFVYSCGIGLMAIAGLTFFVNNDRTIKETYVYSGVITVYILFFGLFIGLTKQFGEAKKTSNVKIKKDADLGLREDRDLFCIPMLYSVICLPLCALCLMREDVDDEDGDDD